MRFLPFFLLAYLLFSLPELRAQQSKVIQIDTAGTMRGQKVGETYITYLSGDVALTHQGSRMYCDSCELYEAKKSFKAYGHVVIIEKDGTILSADFIRYEGYSRQCYARGNVELNDQENNLWTEHLDYNLDSKIGVYKGSGVLQDDETTLWSDHGTYNGKTKWSRFTKNVRIVGPDYDIVSDDLEYNSTSEEVKLHGYSELYRDSALMITQGKAYYDSKNGFADFKAPSIIYQKNQSIAADTLQYDKNLGYAYARGHVVLKDTQNDVLLYSHETYYLEKEKETISYGDPLLIRYDSSGADTLFLISDTMRTFDVISEINNFLVVDSAGVESMQSDTIYAKNFLVWDSVQVYADSIQAVADSMYFSEIDSVLRMYRDPVLWSDQRQLKGDTIYIFWRDSESIDSVRLLTKSSVLSVPDNIPEAYNQILGNWINAFFENKDIDSVEVIKNAQCIYYVEDENKEYIGIHRSESKSLYASFDAGEIAIIKLYEKVDGKMIPMQGADYKSILFPDTQWLGEKRPRDKTEFYRRMVKPSLRLGKE